MSIAWELLGWTGAVAVLAAYALLSAGRLPPDWRYQALNLGGAAGLAANGIVHAAWPSVGVNTIWLVIGFGALAGQLLRNRTHRRRVSGAGAAQPHISRRSAG